MATNIILCPPSVTPPTTIRLCDPTTVGTAPTVFYRRTIRGLDATGYDDWTISYQA